MRFLVLLVIAMLALSAPALASHHKAHHKAHHASKFVKIHKFPKHKVKVHKKHPKHHPKPVPPPVVTPPVTPPDNPPVVTPPVVVPPVVNPPTPPINPSPPAPPDNPPVAPPVNPPIVPPSNPVWSASYTNGLFGFNTAGVGDVVPTVVSTPNRDGPGAGRFILTGSQNRSELIVGGDGSSSSSGEIQLNEGQHFRYAFSIYVEQMIYGHPGAHNLFFQLKSDGTGSPELALYLWDYEGQKGLWVSSHGDRYVSPFSEQTWHDIVVDGVVSATNGSYTISVDGNVVESQSGISTLVPGEAFAYLKSGLYRNGAAIPGTSIIYLDAHSLTY